MRRPWPTGGLLPQKKKKLITDTVELQLSGLIARKSHPDMQKIRIIEFFFENRLHGQSKVGKKFYKRLL